MIGAALALALASTPVTLEQVRQLARENTQALQARLQAQQAEEQTRVARAAILPQLQLQAGADLQHLGPAVGNNLTPVFAEDRETIVGFRREIGITDPIDVADYRATIGVTQLLYDGGRWWKQIAQAGAQAEAARGQFAEQQLSSELEGVRRFYELFRAQKAREVLEATVKQSEAQLERASALFEAGRVQKRDVIAAAINLGNDRISVLRQGQRIGAAQADLAIWLRRPGTDELAAVEPPGFKSPPAAAPAQGQVLKAAQAQRPLLRALEQQVRAAELGVGLVTANYLPRLSLFANAGRQAPAPQLFFGDVRQQNFVGGGFNLTWDIFSGFGTHAAAAQARYSQASAELTRAQAEREVEGDVHRALAALLAELDVSKIAAQNRNLAASGLSLAEDRFQAGAGSTLDVRDAQLKLTQSELAALEARIDIEITRAGVERVMGAVHSGSGAEP